VFWLLSWTGAPAALGVLRILSWAAASRTAAALGVLRILSWAAASRTAAALGVLRILSASAALSPIRMFWVLSGLSTVLSADREQSLLLGWRRGTVGGSRGWAGVQGVVEQG